MTKEPTTLATILWDLVLGVRQPPGGPQGNYPKLSDAIDRTQKRISDHIIDLIRRSGE